MKLFSLLLIGIYADEPEPNYSDDLRYTRCQAVHLQAISNFTVPESHITEDPPGYICPDPLDTGNGVDAWQQGVKKWDKNKNSQTGMYDVGYFYLSESDSAKVNTIDNKFKEWGQKTCVNFVKVSKNDSKYEKKLKIEFTGGCASYVGSHYAEQTMWLGPRCENSYIPLHEAMHAIGFWHEHQRGDRDDHVQINANACSMSGQSFDVNFGKTHYTWGNTGHAYDFGSIMHYDPFACARSRSNPVITYPGTNTAVVLTKGDTFSDIDVAQINAMYPCDKTQTTQKPTTTTTEEPTTTEPTTTTSTTRTTTTTTTIDTSCPDPRVRPPISRDSCIDLNDLGYLNMKVMKDGYTNGLNAGSDASVRCATGYQLNIPVKLKTKATCTCNGPKCTWVFSRGDVMCSKCGTPVLQGKNGKSVTIVNRWDTGVALMWRLKPYKISVDGWSVGMMLAEPLNNDFEISSNALDVTGISNHNQYFTFTPKETSNIWDGTQGKMVNMIVAFEFSGDGNKSITKDIENIILMSNYYYKRPEMDQSCTVDRFECYPLDT